MDASKAFDKVNHWHLFDKLLNRGVPVYVVRMLLYWHTYQDFILRWSNTLSPSFKVSNGVKQGGVLSPRLFSVYIDDLSKALSKANIGCHFEGIKLNCAKYENVPHRAKQVYVYLPQFCFNHILLCLSSLEMQVNLTSCGSNWYC